MTVIRRVFQDLRSSGSREAFEAWFCHRESSGYDEARQVWNGMIDPRPALIARCVGTAYVTSAVDLARQHGLLVAMKGGGHNAAGNAVCP